MANFNLNDYVDVQTRITKFWEEHPDGAIRTALASDPADFKTCRYRADVYVHRDNPAPDATGYAFEIAGTGMANKTSHEENCETSAIGRALANLGYATSQKDRPSKQEMTKVAAQAPQQPRSAPKPVNATPDTNAPKDINRDKANKRAHALMGHGLLHDAAAVKFNVQSVNALTTDQLNYLSDLEEGKGDKDAIAGWNAWKQRRQAQQQELMPGVDIVPNPDPNRHTA